MLQHENANCLNDKQAYLNISLNVNLDDSQNEKYVPYDPVQNRWKVSPNRDELRRAKNRD